MDLFAVELKPRVLPGNRWVCVPAWFAEIEPFPSAVLALRWPHVANLGDMKKLAKKVLAGEIESPDVLVGGTPCFTAGHMVLCKMAINQ